jgi:anti-sigma factor RsiW
MHVSEDHLELYCLGRLSKKKHAVIEEHIYSCPECAAKATEAQETINAIRTTLKSAPKPKSPGKIASVRRAKRPLSLKASGAGGN